MVDLGYHCLGGVDAVPGFPAECSIVDAPASAARAKGGDSGYSQQARVAC